jgi:hypothetical protein
MRANKQRKDLLRDPLAYVESIGKHDKANTLDALADEGRDTILRVCMTTPHPVPLRALGYVTVLEHIGRKYLPYATRQLIIAHGTSLRVNGTSQQSYENVESFFDELAYRPRHTADNGRLFFGRDIESNGIDMGRLAVIMRGASESKQLEAQAARRKSDYLPYLAAHILLHDTVTAGIQYMPDYTPGRPTTAKRVISIGAQSERVFYNARMRFRDAGGTHDDLAQATGQIFTKHVAPPYLPRRNYAGYEPSFDPPMHDMLALRDPILDDVIATRMDSRLRDLRYVRDYSDAIFASHNLGVTTLQNT